MHLRKFFNEEDAIEFQKRPLIRTKNIFLLLKDSSLKSSLVDTSDEKKNLNVKAEM